MLFLLLFFATVATICLLTVWSWPAEGTDASPSSPGGAAPAAEPESLEGVLVAQLIAGRITPAQYRRTIEGVAARDDERHPLAIPPGTADA